jgi:hypothetical protein
LPAPWSSARGSTRGNTALLIGTGHRTRAGLWYYVVLLTREWIWDTLVFPQHCTVSCQAFRVVVYIGLLLLKFFHNPLDGSAVDVSAGIYL